MIVNQWVPAAHQGDAVGDHARALRAILRDWGHTADIYALTIDTSLEGDVHPWSDGSARQGDVTILHFAMPSPMTESFGRLPGGRVLCYHNVTPSHFFAPYDANLVRLTTLGRQELETLVDRVDVAAGVSDYNRLELEAMGFAPTAVLPLLVDTHRLTSAPRRPALEALLQDGLVNILFVGRIAPNKRIEDHIRLAEHYKRYVDAYYRFIFVGKTTAVPGYFESVQALISEYRMLPERFWFPGQADTGDLAAYYRNAHAYVSLSEHEGFCAPLVEAMACDVPVLAYAAAAVPETLGGAGVTFWPKDLEQAAELLGALVYDQPFRGAVQEGQRARLAEFSLDRNQAKIADALAPFAIGPAIGPGASLA